MIITRTPLRISFLGGGTDYPSHFLKHGGSVLASSIDRYCFVTANRFPSHLFDYSIRLSYSQSELVKRTQDIRHNVFRACLQHCRIERDIELHTVADLPSFTGLGSSSSFTVSLLHALYTLEGKCPAPIELAYDAIYIERTLLEESVGCQDQVLAACGGFNRVEFRAEDDIAVHAMPISQDRIEELESHLLMIFTGIKRSAEMIASKQTERAELNKDTLMSMHKMVDQGYDILCSNRSLFQFGALLHESWMLKRNLEDTISNAHIDTFYQRGLEAGAWGGKILGAGGGGFLLFLVPPEKKADVIQAFPNHHVLTPKLNTQGSQVIFSSQKITYRNDKINQTIAINPIPISSAITWNKCMELHRDES